MKRVLIFSFWVIVFSQCHVIEAPEYDNPNNLENQNKSNLSFVTNYAKNEFVRLTELKQIHSNKVKLRSGMIKVPRDFATIQEAVDAASPGCRIQVSSGTYVENISVVTDNLRITAKNGVYVNGGFSIFSDHTKISGFKINLTESSAFGVHVSNSEQVSITGFSFSEMEFAEIGGAILIENSLNCHVSGNVITRTRSFGIVSNNNSNIHVKQNSINYMRDTGIWITGSTSDVIENNKCYTSGSFGILVMGNDNTIIKNTSRFNLAADIALGPGVTGNIFERNIYDSYIDLGI